MDKGLKGELVDAVKLLHAAQRVGSDLIKHLTPGWPSELALTDAYFLDKEIAGFLEKYKEIVDAIGAEAEYEGKDFMSLVEACMEDEKISKAQAISMTAKNNPEAHAAYVKGLKDKEDERP